MGAILDSFVNLWHDTGIANFNYQNGIMIIVSFIFLYLAIRRGFEPLLLVPIAFGMLLSNLPVSGIFIEHFELTSSNQLSDAGEADPAVPDIPGSWFHDRLRTADR